MPNARHPPKRQKPKDEDYVLDLRRASASTSGGEFQSAGASGPPPIGSATGAAKPTQFVGGGGATGATGPAPPPAPPPPPASYWLRSAEARPYGGMWVLLDPQANPLDSDLSPSALRARHQGASQKAIVWVPQTTINFRG